MTTLIRLALVADREAAETAAQALEDTPPAPVSIACIAESGGRWSLEALYESAPDRNQISSLLRQALGTTLEFDLGPLPERDWVAESLKRLAPVRAGRFVVHGHHDRGTAPPGAISIEIDAGAAFGTGHHATTLGCLQALDRLSRRWHPRRVLDVGTGTGVLAIAAAKLWKAPVLAGDIDPRAVAVAHANARANSVDPLVFATVADGVRHPRLAAGAPYDLIVANILARPLARLAGPLSAVSLRCSKIVLSGILESQVGTVLAPWRAHGFRLGRRQLIDGWATLTLTR